MSKSPKDTKGPVVKSGPTRGLNRSRTKDGQWRSKRSDSGKSRDKGGKSGGKKGCFLTTAACGYRGLPDDCHELQVLRQLRDEVLLKTRDGAALVENYYQLAPGLVPLLDDPRVAEKVWRDIRKAVEQAGTGHTSGAVSTYRAMVEELLRVQAGTAVKGKNPGRTESIRARHDVAEFAPHYRRHSTEIQEKKNG